MYGFWRQLIRLMKNIERLTKLSVKIVGKINEKEFKLIIEVENP